MTDDGHVMDDQLQIPATYYNVCLAIIFMPFILVVTTIVCARSCLKQTTSKTNAGFRGMNPDHEEGLWYEDIAKKTTLLSKITNIEADPSQPTSGEIELHAVKPTEDQTYENTEFESKPAERVYCNVEWKRETKGCKKNMKSKDLDTKRYTNVIIVNT